VYVVDASVWVSWFVPDDAHHDSSHTWINAQVTQGEPMVAPVLALAEVAGAVVRRTGSPELAAGAIVLIQRLPNARLVPVDAGLAHLGARLAGELRLRGADSLYVALAQRLGFTLVTWDQEQLERGRSVAATHTPAQELQP
jgi:predicted nucleic acid-binding protein